MRKSLLLLTLGMVAACGSDKKPTDAKDPNATVTKPSDTVGGNDNDTVYDGPTIATNGRFAASGANKQFNWAGTSIKVRAKGTSVNLGITSTNTQNYQPTMDVFVDGQLQDTPVIINANVTTYAQALPDATVPHIVEWRLRTEANYSNVAHTFTGVTPAAGTELMPTPRPLSRQIEFIGDSMTNGYGINAANGDPVCSATGSQSGALENSDKAFAAVTANLFNADFRLIASSGRGVFRNGGTTSDTRPTVRNLFGGQLHSYADSGTVTADYDPNGWAPQVVVINLGTNDFARRRDSVNNASAIPDETAFRAAYAGLITDVVAKYPNAHIIPCIGPMLADTMSVPASYDSNTGTTTFTPNASDTTTKPLTNAKAFITSAIADARSTLAASSSAAVVADLVVFPPQDTASTACDSHPSVSTHQSMANALSSAITAAVPGWTL